MKLSKKLLVAVHIILVLALVLIVYLLWPRPDFSENVLYLTTKTTTLEGVVQSTGKDSFVMTYDAEAPTRDGKAVKKSIRYTVRVTSQTLIRQGSQEPTSIYTSGQTNGNPVDPKRALASLSPGQMIRVVSSEDLRLLKKDEFNATLVDLANAKMEVRGNVINISETALTVGSIAVNRTYTSDPNITPAHEQYTIALTSSTTYNEVNYTRGSRFKQIAQQDIRVGDEIVVDTDMDLNTTKNAPAVSILKIPPRPTFMPTPFVTPQVVK